MKKLWLALKRALFVVEDPDRGGWTPPAPMPPARPLERPTPPPSRLGHQPSRMFNPTPGPALTVPDTGMSFGLGLGGGLLAHQLLQQEERRRETSSSSPAPAPVIIDDGVSYSDPIIAPFGPAPAPPPEECTVRSTETYECAPPAPAPYEAPSPAPYEAPAPSPSYDSSSYSSDSGSSSSSSDW